jgi:hypothetical protein
MNEGVVGRVLIKKTECKKSCVSVPVSVQRLKYHGALVEGEGQGVWGGARDQVAVYVRWRTVDMDSLCTVQLAGWLVGMARLTLHSLQVLGTNIPCRTVHPWGLGGRPAVCPLYLVPGEGWETWGVGLGGWWWGKGGATCVH